MNATSPSPELGPTRFRKLRIAWSAVCGIGWLLVVVLWARSYSGVDEFGGPLPRDMQYSIVSARGFLAGDVSFVYGPDDRFEYGFIREPPAEDDIASTWRLVAPYGISTWNHRLNFRIPDALTLIFLGTVGVLPWVVCSRRFSLRTLLIATTPVAMALGLIVWISR